MLQLLSGFSHFIFRTFQVQIAKQGVTFEALIILIRKKLQQ